MHNFKNRLIEHLAKVQSREEGDGAAWGGGGLVVILLIVVLLILIF